MVINTSMFIKPDPFEFLVQASIDFPQTQWSLQIHKYGTDASGNMFIESIYHSIQVNLLKAPLLDNGGSVADLGEGSSDTLTTLSPSHGLKLEDMEKDAHGAAAPVDAPPDARDM